MNSFHRPIYRTKASHQRSMKLVRRAFFDTQVPLYDRVGILMFWWECLPPDVLQFLQECGWDSISITNVLATPIRDRESIFNDLDCTLLSLAVDDELAQQILSN